MFAGRQAAATSAPALPRPANEPTISVKLDVHERRIFVTRGLLCYVQEAYDAGGGVIESREATKWTRELVGTIHLDDFTDREPLRDELICLIWLPDLASRRRHKPAAVDVGGGATAGV
jgi:hypothetical protein